jgi:hypothetical protein
LNNLKNKIMAANGQKLRVAVTKTSAQGKAAQSATPNLMSFSTDENSVWFNGKKYGVHKFNNVSSLNTNSTAEQVLSALNVSKSSELYDLAHKGVLFIDTISGNTIVKYEDGDDTFQLYVPSSDSRSIKKLTITVSSNKVTGLTTISHLIVDDIRNTLTSTETNKALSAAMGKKLQDEKLAKTDVVNNLTTTDTSKALSAAQGKALNDRINGLGSPYKVKGTKTNISDVLSLTDAKVGDVWNVTNEFTLGGKKYPAGTNVVCVTATSSSDHNDDNWDALGGTVDLTPYLTKSDASNTYAKKADTDTSFEEIWEQLGVVVAKDEIVNNLTSSETNKPLSAAMGKKLQDEKLSKTDASNTYAKKADVISYYNIGELTALNSNPTQEQLKTALGAPSTFRNAIDAGKLILVTGHNNIQSQKSAVCIIDSGNVIVKYLHPGNNDWIVIAKCVPASSGDNWDNAQFSVRIVKPSDSAGITIE